MTWCTISLDGYPSRPGAPSTTAGCTNAPCCPIEKGVVSSTLPEAEATWENSRVFRDGGGLRLLPDTVSGSWDLASSTTLPDGTLGLHYRRG